MALKTSHKVAGASAAAVIAVAVAFTPNWEGMKTVASRDKIGTGHPIDYCYGQTDEFGKVKVGTRFTKAQCDEKLAESLPKYLDKIGPAVHVPVPVKTMAALLDAAYNAGPAAVARSPMVAKINAGNIAAGCEAFKGWYVRSAGQVRKGLIARRAGETIGDTRKSERKLCLEGLSDPGAWYQHGVTVVPSKPIVEAPKPPVAPAKPVEAPKAVKAPWYVRLWHWLMETN
jgi:lysozyme